MPIFQSTSKRNFYVKFFFFKKTTHRMTSNFTWNLLFHHFLRFWCVNKAPPLNYLWFSKKLLPSAQEARTCLLKCTMSFVYFDRILHWQPRKTLWDTTSTSQRHRAGGNERSDEDECSAALTKSYTDLFCLWLTRIKWQVKRTQNPGPASAYSTTVPESLYVHHPSIEGCLPRDL